MALPQAPVLLSFGDADVTEVQGPVEFAAALLAALVPTERAEPLDASSAACRRDLERVGLVRGGRGTFAALAEG